MFNASPWGQRKTLLYAPCAPSLPCAWSLLLPSGEREREARRKNQRIPFKKETRPTLGCWSLCNVRSRDGSHSPLCACDLDQASCMQKGSRPRGVSEKVQTRSATDWSVCVCVCVCVPQCKRMAFCPWAFDVLGQMGFARKHTMRQHSLSCECAPPCGSMRRACR